jgi:hypothetical protein
MSITLAWMIWLGMFVAIEGAALKDKKPGDTLTEHVRKWFAIGDKPDGWKARRGALIAFLIWLPLHFFNIGPF